MHRVYKTSRADGASEDPALVAAGKKYKTSFYRMLGDVSLTRDFLQSKPCLCGLECYLHSLAKYTSLRLIFSVLLQIKQGKTGIF